MQKLRYGIVITICIIFVLLYVFVFKNDGHKFRTEKITRGTITERATATGTVNPLTTVLVGTQVSGRIKALYVDYNDPVTRGQLIAEIDPATFDAQLEEARANLLSATANLAKAEATLADTDRNLKRQKKLFADNVIGESERDAIETKYQVDKSHVAVARAQVVQAQAAFNFAETNLRYTKIYSPIDGIVISRDVDVGQTVAAAFQTPTLYTIARDLKEMQINTNVDEADIGKIKVGQAAEFTVDAYPETTFAGEILQIRNAPIVVQNVVTYDVVIRVDNPDLKLKPGMTASVSIIIVTKKDIVRIPNAALRFRPEDYQDYQTVQGERCIWILNGQNPECIMVKTGIDDYAYTELVAGSLVEGQKIITGYLTTANN